MKRTVIIIFALLFAATLFGCRNAVDTQSEFHSSRDSDSTIAVSEDVSAIIDNGLLYDEKTAEVFNRFNGNYIRVIDGWCYYTDVVSHTLSRKPLPWDNDAECETVGSIKLGKGVRPLVVNGGCLYYSGVPNGESEDGGCVLKFDISAMKESVAVEKTYKCLSIDALGDVLYFTTADHGVYSLDLHNPEAKPAKLRETDRQMIVQCSDGLVYLGGMDLLEVFDPANGREWRFPVSIVSFAINNNDVYYLDLNNGKVCRVTLDFETEGITDYTVLTDDQAVGYGRFGDKTFVSPIGENKTLLLNSEGDTLNTIKGRSPIVIAEGVFMLDTDSGKVILAELSVK